MTHVPPALVQLAYMSPNDITSIDIELYKAGKRGPAFQDASLLVDGLKFWIPYDSIQLFEFVSPPFPSGMTLCAYHMKTGKLMRAIVHPDSAARLLQLVEASKAIPTPEPAKTKTQLLQELVDELRLNPYFGRIAVERVEHYKQNPL